MLVCNNTKLGFTSQVNNESAIRFYQNFGFDIVETKEQYYKRIEPADAFVLEKKLKKKNADDGENENWTWRNRICYSDV